MVTVKAAPETDAPSNCSLINKVEEERFTEEIFGSGSFSYKEEESSFLKIGDPKVTEYVPLASPPSKIPDTVVIPAKVNVRPSEETSATLLNVSVANPAVVL